MSAVDSLAQFGTTLLTLIERKEQAHYLEVQQQNAWQLAELVLTQQTQALAIDEKQRRTTSQPRNRPRATGLPGASAQRRRQHR